MWFFNEKNNSRDFGILFRKWPSKKKYTTPHRSQHFIFLFHKGTFHGRITWKERITTDYFIDVYWIVTHSSPLYYFCNIGNWEMAKYLQLVSINMYGMRPRQKPQAPNSSAVSTGIVVVLCTVWGSIHNLQPPILLRSGPCKCQSPALTLYTIHHRLVKVVSLRS